MNTVCAITLRARLARVFPLQLGWSFSVQYLWNSANYAWFFIEGEGFEVLYFPFSRFPLN